jgi:FkbH-like protein
MHYLKIISDFNAGPFARYLTSQLGEDKVTVDIAPYGQVYQSLSAPVADQNSSECLIWTLAERVVPTFWRAINLEEIDAARCLEEVDAFADALLSFARPQKNTFLVSWVLPPEHRGYGMLDWRPDIGLLNLLARMNLRLSEKIARAPNLYMLDAGRWLQAAPRAYAPKMWYAAKVPYSNEVFAHAAEDVVAAMLALSGASRRVIILDLDNTLWGGIVGETGWEGIRLGGHEHVGEAFRDFQRELLALATRGIQLAIVSKNDEATALEAIDRHPEMLLRRQHFAGWRINWEDKASNIVALVDEINLGLSSAVFIDDNPVERDRIRSAVPEVLVPEWPADPTGYVRALRSLNCFDAARLSKEDRGRTAMYAAERERREISKIVNSQDDWLRQLGTSLTVDRLNKSNLARVAQLFNKTNQLNLTTRRLTEAEILEWAKAEHHSLLTISLADKFGDMGLVGIVSVEVLDKKGSLVDFILSCRAMGRRVENAMYYLAVNEATRLGAIEMESRYLATPRNGPTLKVLRGLGVAEPEEHVFFDNRMAEVARPSDICFEFVQP